MVLSDNFSKLWKDSQFRTRLTVVIVDKAHCIDEWGGEDFRPQYRLLERLRVFTGQEVPIVCCTATATTSTFNIIWKTLGYGNRPFWGLDVGSDRPNLFYITQPIINTANPLLDILFILPQALNDTTLLDAIAKCLLYFDSENACRLAVQFIRKCLPAHLRSCVQAFSSNMSEAAKKRCWELFKSGEIRIICATDAAGMGCNIPNVKYVISFGIPKSVGTVAQRWGRAGRDRKTDGVCLLLVPKWAFRPDKSAVATHALQRGRQKAPETKTDTLKRARLDTTLETFINIGSSEPPGLIIFAGTICLLILMSVCAHKFLRENFSPNTLLMVCTSLDGNGPIKIGARSTGSSFEMTWTVLDLQRTPPYDRCCYVCNPASAQLYAASDNHDPRLRTFAAEFLQLLGLAGPSQPSSSVSTRTNDSHLSTFMAVTGGVKVSSEQKESLRKSLIVFRQQLWEEYGSQSFFSSQMYLPPKQLESFIQHCPKYLSTHNITSSFLRKLVKWDSARQTDLEKLANIILDWRESIQPVVTPTSQCRARKKTKPMESPNRTPRPVPPPIFTPLPPRPRPIPQPVVRPRPSNFHLPVHPALTPTAQLPVSGPISTPPMYNPSIYHHVIPPLTPLPHNPLPHNPLPHNPYHHYWTAPIRHLPATAYPYPHLIQYPGLIYQTPVKPTQSPASPVENSPPPPRDPNHSSFSSP